MGFRIGFGNDVHRLVPKRRLVVGGVELDSRSGASGHSDADVLLHAVTDAILGALALGDIGVHFPNSDPKWRNADSRLFVQHAAALASEKGYAIVNIDSVVNLESPKLRPYIDEMRANIAEALEIDVSAVSVKAKSGEGVDAVGNLDAIRAEAVVLLQQNE